MRWEATNASTTQLMGAIGSWDDELFTEIGVSRLLVGEVSDSGERVGAVGASEALSAGIHRSTQVISVASHDTASAVVAVPALTADFAYISSGTWSLVGVELPSPLVTVEGMHAGFTNERGIDGTVRYLRNVMGFWLLQQVIAEFQRRSYHLSPAELSLASESVPPFSFLIDAEDELLLGQGDMCGRIAVLARQTSGSVPERPEEFARCIFDSLAVSYRRCIRWLAANALQSIEMIHIVGGGSLNEQLCQLTADACSLPVYAGPTEAAAIGNGLMQLRALGLGPSDRWEMRRLVAQSLPPKQYLPNYGRSEEWERAEGIVDRVRSSRRKAERS
jgi:rhamnulokinase